MEIQGRDGSKIRLTKNSKTVLGRDLGFHTKDTTVSRRHLIFQLLQTPLNKDVQQTEPKVSFRVIGKNPIWVRRGGGGGGGDVEVYKKLDEGEAAAGDSFCVANRRPCWLDLKRIEDEEEEESDLESGNLEIIDVLEIDPVKEFGFIVIGKEFESYPKQKIREIKHWNWFLEGPERNNSDEDESFDGKKKMGGGRRKRKKGGGGDEEDDDWTGECEDDKEIVSRRANIVRPKYSTRSKDTKKPQKDAKNMKGASARRKASGYDGQEDEDGDTLGGFIVNDEDEEKGEELDASDDEEVEFIEDDDEEDEVED